MPYRSSSSPADIGLSKAEYEDAVNLEKLYFLANKNDRCANCGRGGVSAVDVSRYEFLCPSCCSNKSSVKKIGEDRFSSFEVNKLHAKFDREGSRKARTSASPVGRTAFSSGGGRRSERRGERRSSRRPPVPEYSEDSESDSADDVPPPRRSRSMPRAASSRTPRHQAQRTQLDPFDDFDAASTASWGGGASTPASSWTGDFNTNRSTGGPVGVPSSPAGMMRLGTVQQHNPAQMGMIGMVSPMAGMAGNMVGMHPPQQGWNPNASMAAVAAGGLPTASAGMGMLGAGATAGMLARQQHQYQQALLQQFAAAGGRPVGGPVLGSINPVAGVSPSMQMGNPGAMHFGTRPPPFPGTAQQQAPGTNPFLSMQHPQHGGGVAVAQPHSMGNPFLSMQQPQACAGAGTFGSLGGGGTAPGGVPPGFQQCMGRGAMGMGGAQQLGSMGGPMGAAGGGALPASNPFSSMGGMPAQAQRPVAMVNSTNPGGSMAGNPYNTSIW